ncbi:PEP-CTERM sorting domain-containing protein [Botrimarina colliarenosi]|nr:PEP-CTERM sorting domain-containing protein [Botrimarina colliarenosi]
MENRNSYLASLAKQSGSYAEFSKRIASYAAAAGAGAFATAQSADAEIIHVDLGAGLVQDTAASFTNLDLDGNGTTDFVFGQSNLSYSGVRLIVYGNDLFQPPEERLPAAEQSINFTNTAKGNPYYIRSFEFGDEIAAGLSVPFNNGTGYPNLSGIVSTNPTNFRNPDDPQYWGFGLNIDGNIHYGWARLSTFSDGGSPAEYTATLYEYAYQSEPNVPILAGAVPEATSLALLAAGGGGLALTARRRRRDA